MSWKVDGFQGRKTHHLSLCHKNGNLRHSSIKVYSKEMAFKTSELGCFEFEVGSHKDSRGSFVKLFNSKEFTKAGFSWDIEEIVFSQSKRGVLRGLHFQEPPHAQNKILTCIEGEIFEVVVDLRKDSKTFGCHEIFTLSAQNHKALVIPVGFAQGFLVLSESAGVAYGLSHEFKAESDKGILWSSAGIPWPNKNPLLSNKDQQWPLLENHRSPF